MNLSLARRALLGLAVSVLPLSAHAQQTPPAPAAPVVPAPAAKPEPKIDADAKKLVQQMVSAHQALTAYSATITGTVQAGAKTQSLTAKVLYAKPNKASVTTEITAASKITRQVVSDGKYIYSSTSTDAKTYDRQEATPAPTNIAQVMGLSGAGVTGLLPLIVSDPLASERVIPATTEVLEFAPDETLDGVAVRVVKSSISTPAPVTFTLAIGKADSLLRRVTLQTGTGERQILITETYTATQPNPQTTDASFKFVPAPGATLKAPAKTTQASPDAAFDPRLKVGAAPLPLKGTDTKGQPVSLAAYKGRVVLVDFWATWCPPCREEVPNVVAAYKKYHAQGFDVVGVSLDQPDDGAKLASFAKSNQMTWRQVHDKSNTIASGYSVKFIPFAMLIGRDGKIAAVNVRGPELDKAVAAALRK